MKFIVLVAIFLLHSCHFSYQVIMIFLATINVSYQRIFRFQSIKKLYELVFKLPCHILGCAIWFNVETSGWRIYVLDPTWVSVGEIMLSLVTMYEIFFSIILSILVSLSYFLATMKMKKIKNENKSKTMVMTMLIRKR